MAVQTIAKRIKRFVAFFEFPKASKVLWEKKSVMSGQTLTQPRAHVSALYISETMHIFIIVLFVETPRKFTTAKLSIRKPGSMKIRAYGMKALQ
jgi:hypothetical protein